MLFYIDESTNSFNLSSFLYDSVIIICPIQSNKLLRIAHRKGMVGPDYLFLSYVNRVTEITYQPWGLDLTPEKTTKLRKIYFAVNLKIVRALKYWSTY